MNEPKAGVMFLLLPTDDDLRAGNLRVEVLHAAVGWHVQRHRTLGQALARIAVAYGRERGLVEDAWVEWDG